jgi:hypothetical protein
MSTAQKAEPGTSVATSDGIGKLPLEMQQALYMRRMRNQVAGELAKQNWGKNLDLDARRAVADWGQQFRVDTTTEIQVLGGNIYLAAAFYLRGLGEMIDAGLVDYAVADHVEEDPRLKKLGPEGEQEFSRRLRERIAHAIPDAAASAVVFRVKLKSMSQEVTGVKWCGGGTRKNDPVGEQFPVETSESRAARRCLRLLVSHVPPATARALETIEQSAELLSERIKSAKLRIAELDERATIHPRAIAQGDAADPYGVGRRSIGAGEGPVSTIDAPKASGPATKEQTSRIVEMLNNPALDLASSMIEMYANEANAKDFTASAADALIAKLDALIPATEG